jgi:hypothetical protein
VRTSPYSVVLHYRVEERETCQFGEIYAGVDIYPSVQECPSNPRGGDEGVSREERVWVRWCSSAAERSDYARNITVLSK